MEPLYIALICHRVGMPMRNCNNQEISMWELQYDWNNIVSLGVKTIKLDDSDFQDGDKACRLFSKIPYIPEITLESNAVYCTVIGCSCKFDSLAEYETHQRAKHLFNCNTCHSTLPTAYLLDRHILEYHDSFFQIMAKTKPMYDCLLEGCKFSFANADERKHHCISEHQFPPDFTFDLSLKRVKTKHKSGESPSAKATKRKNPVPKVISFGAGMPKGFAQIRPQHSNRPWHSKGKSGHKNDNEIDMTDMADVLEEMQT